VVLRHLSWYSTTGTATSSTKTAAVKQAIAIPPNSQLTPVPATEKGSTSTQKPTKTTTQAHKVASDLDPDPDALKALNAILHYNNHVATAHHQRWTISISIMKDLLKQVGKSSQPKVDAVLKAKSEEIKKHHRLQGLGERHNRIHQGASISDLIQL
jgi:hypothetical protein